jgi:glycosyltransferase involved in cell wall biosynthesis
MFDKIEECDDMWTQLAREMCKDDYGEVWYWGGKRVVKYSEHFVERWVPSFDKTQVTFNPDIVFARGGFPHYDGILRSIKGFKIYYGAGHRHVPQSKFKNYNLILADSHQQLAEIQKRFPQIKSSLFIKPAADNIFRPQVVDKKYDVLFVGNESKGDKKGHHFGLSLIPKTLSAVCVGIASKNLRSLFPNVHFTGWIPRKEIPLFYAQSRIALVCAAKVDSCPRIIPEALACGCPLLVLDSVRFWKERYITQESGVLSSKEKIRDSLIQMLTQANDFKPYEHYREHLTLSKSSEFIKNLSNWRC